MPDRATTDEPLPLRLPEGTVLGRFVVDGWVRDGGMAGLYRGRRVGTEERVAIKVQLPASASDPLQRARFDREVEVMRRLAGAPHVVRLHDDGALDDGRRYLVTEWLEGDNLEEHLDRLRDDDRHLELPRLVRVARELAAGLDEIHRERIVHRDIKPANIMVTATSGGDERVTIVDFGVSADLGAGGHDQELTLAGMVVGTSGYMAPEQAAGVGAHPSFDVYAFGAVLYEAVTGARLPPSGWSSQAVASITKLRPKTPPLLAELVSACLDPSPMRRPQGAEELMARLEEIGSPAASMSAVALPEVEAPELAAERSVAAGLIEEPVVRREAPATGQDEAAFDRRWLLVLLIPVLGLGAWWLLKRPSQVPGEVRPAAVVDAPAMQTSGAEHGSESVFAASDHGTGGRSADESSAGSGTSEGAHGMTEADAGVPEDTGGRVVHRPAHGESTDTTADTSTSPAAPTYDEERCARIRERATSAAAQEQWKDVLRHTQGHAECWTKRTEWTELRVKALFNLGEYARCIREGASTKSARVEKFLGACRARLHAPQ